MDLSWCIICDKRIMEDDLLYCSTECKLKDQDISTSPPKPPVLKSWMTKKTAKHVLFKTPTTTSYPWIPLYRKRHNSFKRCQPTVAGSPITANGALLLPSH